jgi:hypothetical protein
MFSQRERDENLLVVAAVQSYSLKHDIPACETVALFQSKGIIDLIRSNYDVLHTQSLSESASFAEDVLKRISD